MSKLFSEFQISGIELKNRIVVSPMCQYSCENGVATDWHKVHLGSRAIGGAGLVMTEACAVNPEGRISPGDLGLWNDEQKKALQSIVSFIQENASKAGIQLAHAGRKASSQIPWKGKGYVSKSEGGWTPMAPSALSFDKESPTPEVLSLSDIQKVISDFKNAGQRAVDCGFDVIEVHAAHGYLVHEFLSPLSNFRKDDYGGSLENRIRLCLEICTEIKKVLTKNQALFVRISATDWLAGGWDIEQSIILAEKLKKVGVDLIDVSTGGLVPHAQIPVQALYQVEFSEKIKKWAKLPTAAVGLITDYSQAEGILEKGQADLIFMAREFLRDPYWPLRQAQALGLEVPAPKQYLRAWK